MLVRQIPAQELIKLSDLNDEAPVRRVAEIMLSQHWFTEFVNC
jgi:hypothetical protein